MKTLRSRSADFFGCSTQKLEHVRLESMEQQQFLFSPPIQKSNAYGGNVIFDASNSPFPSQQPALRSEMSATRSDLYFPETVIYPRRWWLLSLLCISLIQVSNNWLTFSVCYLETNQLYGWNKNQVDWLTMWGPLLFVPFALCVPYLNTKMTFRALMTVSSLFMCIGTTIRAVPPSKLSPNTTLILAHCGQILSAIASPMVMTVPQQLSGAWFPIEERATATSMAVVSGYAGSAVSYLAIYYINTRDHGLLRVLQLEAVFSVIFFILMMVDQIWYNDLPPFSPSVSSLVARECQTEQSAFCDELWVILKNGKFQYFIVLCGAYQGVVSGWIGILDTIFGPDYLGFDESYVGIIGISSIIAIIISGIGCGAVSDRIFKRSIKCMIITMMLFSGIFLVSFAILVNRTEDVITWGLKEEFVRPLAVVLCVIGIATNAGTYGLSYEAAVELSYPSRDIYSGVLLTACFNLFAAAFIFLNNYFSAESMNWTVCIVQFTCCGLLCFYKEEYLRTAVDDAVRSTRTPTAKRSISQYAKFPAPGPSASAGPEEKDNLLYVGKAPTPIL